MNTKIDGLGGPRLEPQARRVGSPGQDTVGAVSPTNALRLDEDSVQISATATAATSAGFDAAKVQQLRADIEAGRYTVDTRALAARLMEIEGSLK
ncbi:flagellar biosynthesis anti-sigma factor FlgM [Aquimonas voraii]|uniref:Negative regulator of flagellin synthesis n=1 Tax=Aquimonas voraii TaxID=265719 RepID=A0A1G6YDD2_9GAMM|nr:flagellar biosynthesis anti-sigma factor FlgM [Aquimonas voraii]SDD87737.1 anti-sigma-28 factor, FlgM family [Aquimonas voraii]